MDWHGCRHGSEAAKGVKLMGRIRQSGDEDGEARSYGESPRRGSSGQQKSCQSPCGRRIRLAELIVVA